MAVKKYHTKEEQRAAKTERQRVRRAAQPEREHIYSQRYRAKHLDAIRERMRRWRAMNTDLDRAIAKRWRDANKEYLSERNRRFRESNPTYWQAHKQWFRDFKQGLQCGVCGEGHPATLDFHHRDPSNKEFDIGYGVSKCYPVARMLTEIEKCDVLCANCHRKLHWKEDGKHEFEAYIRDDPPGHRQSVDDDAKSKGIAPIDDMLQWAQDHANAGEDAP